MDHDELYRWIDAHTITRQKRNLNRDFSDAVPLAEILKQHFPKLVDLHNYTSTFSFTQKMVNWDVINKKVLNKLNINLSKKLREELAKSTPGAIEKVLEEIKAKIEDREASGDHVDDTKILYLENGLELSYREGVVPIKINNGTKTVERKLVPSEMFDKMETDLEEQKETIATLTQKLDHLEKLIGIKDERIKDLSQQLQTIINSPADSTTSIMSQRSRFFSNLF
ncbi:unnamed protein product [Psylliodes chrysocephalus]|uniref:Calponin-homology (CH) domain-containing protein n=1 Tax=Psylliodes chrysocephalus TaxID=3402493 RepID=A0A9P0DAH4_9CUCU|nr:unnamed protein product [Psylliodes chrysocephala]